MDSLRVITSSLCVCPSRLVRKQREMKFIFPWFGANARICRGPASRIHNGRNHVLGLFQSLISRQGNCHLFLLNCREMGSSSAADIKKLIDAGYNIVESVASTYLSNERTESWSSYEASKFRQWYNHSGQRNCSYMNNGVASCDATSCDAASCDDTSLHENESKEIWSFLFSSIQTECYDSQPLATK